MIPFLHLQKINALHAEEIKTAINEVLDSGIYLNGEKVEQFEKQLAYFIGVKHIITCGNGLDALRLILRGYIELGIMHPGDEILIPGHTFIATALAVTENRLVPVFIEPDTSTYNINIQAIEERISSRTKGIIIVHLYGRSCWNQHLETLAQTHSLKIIEDNAQAIGARSNIRLNEKLTPRTGSLGDAAGFSFYPGKNLGALGDAGAIATNDHDLALIVRALANYGSDIKYVSPYKGINSRMDEIQAAILSVKLKYLDEENQKRREIAQYYCEHIHQPNILLPAIPVLNEQIHQWEEHVWHLFVIRCRTRSQLQHYLHEQGIQTLIHYPIAIHRQKAFSEMSSVSLPITERLANEVLSLPISPVLTLNEAEAVVNAINQYQEKNDY